MRKIASYSTHLQSTSASGSGAPRARPAGWLRQRRPRRAPCGARGARGAVWACLARTKHGKTQERHRNSAEARKAEPLRQLPSAQLFRSRPGARSEDRPADRRGLCFTLQDTKLGPRKPGCAPDGPRKLSGQREGAEAPQILPMRAWDLASTSGRSKDAWITHGPACGPPQKTRQGDFMSPCPGAAPERQATAREAPGQHIQANDTAKSSQEGPYVGIGRAIGRAAKARPQSPGGGRVIPRGRQSD